MLCLRRFRFDAGSERFALLTGDTFAIPLAGSKKAPPQYTGAGGIATSHTHEAAYP